MLTAVLNVALGLSFAWLIVSLAAMFFVEWLVSRWRWRSSMLETMINTMLGDPSLTDQLYNHPLIRSLYSGEMGARKPSYIPAKQFTLALLDMIKLIWTDASLYQQQIYALRFELHRLPHRRRKAALARLSSILTMTRRILVSNGLDGVRNLPTDALEDALNSFVQSFPEMEEPVQQSFRNVHKLKAQIEYLLNGTRKTLNDPPGELDELKLGIAALSVLQPRLKQTLSALMSDVNAYARLGENALARLHTNVEAWYNNSMDRLNGAYKRRTYVLALVMGLFLAVLSNTDSIALANQLWKEPRMRDALAQQAQMVVLQNPAGVESLTPETLLNDWQTQIELTSLPVGWVGAPIDGAALDMVGGRCTLEPVMPQDMFGVRMGSRCYPLVNTPYREDSLAWALKGLGLLLTALAAAQGAPFWFDVLKKIVNVRLAGPSPVDALERVG